MLSFSMSSSAEVFARRPRSRRHAGSTKLGFSPTRQASRDCPFVTCFAQGRSEAASSGRLRSAASGSSCAPAQPHHSAASCLRGTTRERKSRMRGTASRSNGWERRSRHSTTFSALSCASSASESTRLWRAWNAATTTRASPDSGSSRGFARSGCCRNVTGAGKTTSPSGSGSARPTSSNGRRRGPTRSAQQSSRTGTVNSSSGWMAYGRTSSSSLSRKRRRRSSPLRRARLPPRPCSLWRRGVRHAGAVREARSRGTLAAPASGLGQRQHLVRNRVARVDPRRPACPGGSALQR